MKMGMWMAQSESIYKQTDKVASDWVDWANKRNVLNSLLLCNFIIDNIMSNNDRYRACLIGFVYICIPYFTFTHIDVYESARELTMFNRVSRNNLQKNRA